MRVNIFKDGRGHPVHSQGLQRTRRCKGRGVGDTDDGQCNDGVEEGRKPSDACRFNRQYERRGLCVGPACAKQLLIVGWKDQPEDEETEDVEDGNPPEDLLGCFGEGFARVFGLGCGQTHEFRTGKGEGCGDEDAAEAFEAVLECFPSRVWIVCLVPI